MDDVKNNKIQKFINDKAMSDAVYETLLASFLRGKPSSDVYLLAASRLAVDFLTQGWKELERLKEANSDKSTPSGNIGL